MRYLPTGNKKIVWTVNVSIITIKFHVLTQVFSVLVLWCEKVYDICLRMWVVLLWKFFFLQGLLRLFYEIAFCVVLGNNVKINLRFSVEVVWCTISRWQLYAWPFLSLDYLVQKVNENLRVHLCTKRKKQLSLKE